MQLMIFCRGKVVVLASIPPLVPVVIILAKGPYI